MKFVDEYRQPELCQKLAHEIRAVATRPWTLMEVCGGQTHGLLRYGIDRALDGVVRLIHGPGCPVCVTPLEAIDRAIQLSLRPDITLAKSRLDWAPTVTLDQGLPTTIDYFSHLPS